MSAKYRIGRLETANPVALNIPNALPTFSDCGYDVTINGRFIGGEMLIRYGWPEINQGVFQANVPIP